MTALDRLADLCGILHESEDAFGNTHTTSPETKRALLAAMGFHVQDDEYAAASLRALRARQWKQGLPPVSVQSGPVTIPVVLPSGAHQLTWKLTLEDGTALERNAAFTELPLLEADELDGTFLERRQLILTYHLPWGYNSLALASEPSACLLIVTPGSCWLPEDSQTTQRLWGVAAQLYLLRSGSNWGVGDFTDLAELMELTKANGGSVLGINPLHAMFPDRPEEASPYSPSDRLLLNILNIDVEKIPEFAASSAAQDLVASADFRDRLAACRDAPLVKYQTVADLKLPVLRLLFSEFEKQADPQRAELLEAFHAERRELLDRACTFQALRAYFATESPEHGDCHLWPQEYRSSLSPGVARFAAEHPDLVRFQLWLQWIADEQLKAVCESGAGMTVGLYRDLAVGAHPSGAEVWSYPDALSAKASVGAPPDIWNPAGQNWGLPPLQPLAAREQGYRSFIDLIRTNMRYAGALRIDHALALQRLYWIPADHHPRDGAYVTYPTEDLIGILALESHRARCLVIGEDLGTVPKGFRERMAQANILSYRVLFFERDKTGFNPPATYPRLSISVVSSHDLPTLRGWWQEADLDLKQTLGLFPKPSDLDFARAKRSEDRDALCALLDDLGLIDSRPLEIEGLLRAAHRLLARTESLIALFQLDDLTFETDQVNVPATSDEHPNWRRKLSLSLEELASQRVLSQLRELVEQSAAQHART